VRHRSLRLIVPLALTLLLVIAPAAGATNDGRGFYGETNDKVVTNAGFIIIAFFPIFVFAMSMLQRRLDKRKQARKAAGPRGVLLIGVDLKKDKATLDAAYADPGGVTAQFNLNLLHRINRELAADFQVKRFRHKAFYDPIMSRIEMHLESLYSQFVHIAGRRFDFAPGETIHTEISCKYSIAEFQELGKRAGFTPEKVWTDPQQLFSVHGMVAA